MQAMKRVGFWLFVGGGVFALLPVAAVLLASLLATIAGCNVNEGGAEACSLLGLDIGGLLYMLFVSGWFALITLPIGVPAVLVGLVLYGIAKVTLWRRNRIVVE